MKEKNSCLLYLLRYWQCVRLHEDKDHNKRTETNISVRREELRNKI
jgi:hypothetical protein